MPPHHPDHTDWPLRPVQLQLMAIDNATEALDISPVKGVPNCLKGCQDTEAISQFLAVRCQAKNTRIAYQRDLRKLFVFMLHNGLTRLAAIRPHHCTAFQQFMLHPASELCSNIKRDGPVRVWITRDHQKVPHPDWKPFMGSMSQPSVDQTTARIGVMFRWLQNQRYLTANPWPVITPLTPSKTCRLGKDSSNGDVEPTFPMACIRAVLHYLEHGQLFAQVSPRKLALWRWCFHFFLYTAAQIDSARRASVDDIYQNAQGETLLTLSVRGRNSESSRLDVPWLPILESEYQRYRAALHLPPIHIFPSPCRRTEMEVLPKDQGPRYLLMPLTVMPNTPCTRPIQVTSLRYHISNLLRTAHEWAIACPEVDLSAQELDILNTATSRHIRYGTEVLLGLHDSPRLDDGRNRHLAAYKAVRIEQKLHTLRYKVDPESLPYGALLHEPLAVRIQWLNRLKKSIEADQFAARHGKPRRQITLASVSDEPTQDS